MNIGFTDQKTRGCYDVLLGKIGFQYVSNIFDGGLYVYNRDNASFTEIFDYFLKRKYVRIIRNKKIDACICLLHNPFFANLCEYIENNADKIPKRKLKLLKEKMFSYLADDAQKGAIQIPNLVGKAFMEKNRCYERSKEIIQLIDKVI